jgi:hypothetical protein
MDAAAADAGFSFDRPEPDNGAPNPKQMSDLIYLSSLSGIHTIRAFKEFAESAAPWSSRYLQLQFDAGHVEGNAEWYVSTPFICMLVMTGWGNAQLLPSHLEAIGWHPDIAARVLQVAKDFQGFVARGK